MGDAGNGATLPRSTTARVDRRALMKSAAALLASTVVAGIGRPALAQRGPVRTLLKGGVVLSYDPAVGDFEKADVLIEDKKIVAVRPDISAEAAVIDASRMIVLPALSTRTTTSIKVHCATYCRTACSQIISATFPAQPPITIVRKTPISAT
jgi:hypothetical protein